MAQEDIKMEMDVLRNWNGKFHSNWLERKKLSSSKGCPFVTENVHLIRAYDLCVNRLNPLAPIVLHSPGVTAVVIFLGRAQQKNK